MLKEYVPWFEYTKCENDCGLLDLLKERITNEVPYFLNFSLYQAPPDRFRIIKNYPEVDGFEDSCKKLQLAIPEICVKDFGFLCKYYWNIPILRFVDITYNKTMKEG